MINKNTMDKEQFEELIAPFTTKIVDEENPTKFKFVPAFRTRRTSYKFTDNVFVQTSVCLVGDVRLPKPPAKRIISPLGEFANAKDAAKGNKVSESHVRLHCRNNTKRRHQ